METKRSIELMSVLMTDGYIQQTSESIKLWSSILLEFPKLIQTGLSWMMQVSIYIHFLNVYYYYFFYFTSQSSRLCLLLVNLVRAEGGGILFAKGLTGSLSTNYKTRCNTSCYLYNIIQYLLYIMLYIIYLIYHESIIGSLCCLTLLSDAWIIHFTIIPRLIYQFKIPWLDKILYANFISLYYIVRFIFSSGCWNHPDNKQWSRNRYW